MSTRTPRPPIEVMIWRSALAVRPPRPMTVPRSSGCTRTSSRCPRRESTIRTRTSSGWSTMPLTRCSSAGRSAASGLRTGVGTGGLLGLCRRLGRSRRCLLRRLLGRLGLDRRDPGGGLGLGLVPGPAVGPGGRHLQRLGRRQALELLPVPGLLEDALDRLARLGADGQPVLGAVGLDLDQRGLLLGGGHPDVLDGPTIALGARVGHDDSGLRGADLAHPPKPDLYGHSVLAPGSKVRDPRPAPWGWCGWGARGLATRPGRGRRTRAGYQHVIVPDRTPYGHIGSHVRGPVPAGRQFGRCPPGRIGAQVAPGAVEWEVARLGQLDQPFALGADLRRLPGTPVPRVPDPRRELVLVLPAVRAVRREPQ